MSYIVMRIFGVPRKAASRFYFDRFSIIEIAIVILIMIETGFIH